MQHRHRGSALGPAVMRCVWYSELEREARERGDPGLSAWSGLSAPRRQGVSTCVGKFTDVSLSEDESH